MNWGVYGILVVFGLFIILLIFNPNLSCFGKKLRSPFYPLVRRRRLRQSPPKKSVDYGFHLSEEKKGQAPAPPGRAEKKTDSHGFRRD